MSIFDTLAESGVTQEDLEKAASARLFAEAAAAEGIDLSELTEDQAEELYDFWANGGEEVEKSASAEDLLAEAAVKEASAKLAEAEYIGRYMARVYADEMDKLAGEGAPRKGYARNLASGAADEARGMYDRAVGGLSRAKMEARYDKLKKLVGATDISEGYKSLKAARKAKDSAARAAAVKQLGKGGLRAGLTAGGVGAAGFGAKKLYDAHKKESSALEGIIEARALELLEEAAYEKVAEGRTTYQAAKDLLSARHVRKNVAEHAGEGADALDKAKSYMKILRGKAGNEMMTSEARKSLAAQAALAGGVGAAGYGAKKMYDAHKKESSALDELALARALELLDEAEIDNELDEAAFDLLRENGYDV